METEEILAMGKCTLTHCHPGLCPVQAVLAAKGLSNAHISSPGVLLYIVIKYAFDRKQKESLELTPNEIEHPELG